MEKKAKISYDELHSTWWAIHRCLEGTFTKEIQKYMTTKAFTELLPQCGWTVKEWNEETELRKKKKKERS